MKLKTIHSVGVVGIIATLYSCSPALADESVASQASQPTQEQVRVRTAAAKVNVEGVRFLNQHKFPEAIAKFDEALKVDPTSKVINVNRACARISLKQYDQAISDLDDAIASGHTSVLSTAYGVRGLAYYHQGKLDIAIADLSKALELNPKAVSALTTRATCYFDQGNKELALADAKKILSFDPKNVAAQNMMKMCKGEAKGIGVVDQHKLKLIQEEIDPAKKK